VLSLPCSKIAFPGVKNHLFVERHNQQAGDSDTVPVSGLLGKVHAAQHRLKVGLGPQGIQDGSSLQTEEPLVMLFVSSLDPCKRFVLVTKAEISVHEESGGNIAMSGDFVQFTKQLLCLLLSPSEAIGPSKF
jgi:hypothetical protein